MDDPVVVAAVRTPIGRFGGALAGRSAVELGAIAAREAIARSGLPAEELDAVVMGCAVQGGLGQNAARQVAIAAGVPFSVPAETVNSVCLSGLSAVAHAVRLVRTGEARAVLAGGFESMSGAPYLLRGARFGQRFGDGVMVDSLQLDGLTCAFDSCSMGESTERYQESFGLTREDQDRWAERSHARAAAATGSGAFADEIVPIPLGGRDGDAVLTADEPIRPTTDLAGLGRLRPAFREGGTITPGNASPLSDGAAAVVVTSSGFAASSGLDVLGRVVGTASVAGPDPSLLVQPAAALRRVLDRSGVGPEGLDLVEINEAFASVVLASVRDLGLDADRVNVNGGAIALGHPLGASGARVLVTLLHALAARGGGRGAAALCGGGGQGLAALVEVS